MKSDLHVSAKGCVVRDEKLLLVQYQDVGEEGHHYNLPGGRVHPNESLVEACKRKFREETGADVVPQKLLFVYEYIGRNHNFFAGDKHSVSLVFSCQLNAGSEPSMEACTHPDTIQTAICWIPINKLHTIDLLPRVQSRLQQLLYTTTASSNPYWGDIL